MALPNLEQGPRTAHAPVETAFAVLSPLAVVTRRGTLLGPAFFDRSAGERIMTRGTFQREKVVLRFLRSKPLVCRLDRKNGARHGGSACERDWFPGSIRGRRVSPLFCLLFSRQVYCETTVAVLPHACIYSSSWVLFESGRFRR